MSSVCFEESWSWFRSGLLIMERGRSEIVGEKMGATKLSVSELGATEEKIAKSVVGGRIR